MPLTPLFTVSQPNATTIRLTDTSTGADAAITQRRVYLQQADGSYLVPTGTTTDYIQWSYGDATIDIDVLTTDYALQILVQWLNVGNTVLYDKTGLYGFTFYNENFLYSLTQYQQNNPTILQDTTYFNNKSKMRVLVDSGDQAIVWGNDITNAQENYEAASYFRLNENLFF
jgi:hypothetical protein